MTHPIKLTKQFIQSLTFATSKPVLYRDSELRGFKLKVGKTKKTFILEKRIHGQSGSARTFKLGTFPQVSIKEARLLGQEYASLCERGMDPLEAKKQSNGSNGYRPVTFKEMFETYFEVAGLKSEKRPRNRLENYLKDWYEKDMRAISSDDLVAKHQHISKRSPQAAGEILKLFCAVWNKVAPLIRENKTRLLPANPAPEAKLTIGKKWRPKAKKRPVIPRAKIGEWMVKVEQLRQSFKQSEAIIGDIITLALFCGFRPTECRTLLWENVDLDMGVIKISSERAKNEIEYFVPLSTYARELMERFFKRRTLSPYVFPSVRKANCPVSFCSQVSKKISREINCQFTPHATRRTFLSIGNHLGIPLLTLKRLVNHHFEGGVTGGYVVPAFDPTKNQDEFQKIGDFIMAERDQYLKKIGQEPNRI